MHYVAERTLIVQQAYASDPASHAPGLGSPGPGHRLGAASQSMPDGTDIPGLFPGRQPEELLPIERTAQTAQLLCMSNYHAQGA
jgi:hypothetical protein